MNRKVLIDNKEICLVLLDSGKFEIIAKQVGEILPVTEKQLTRALINYFHSIE